MSKVSVTEHIRSETDALVRKALNNDERDNKEEGADLLHEVEEDIQEGGYEGLHLLKALSIKGVYEAAQRYHSIHPHLHRV